LSMCLSTNAHVLYLKNVLLSNTFYMFFKKNFKILFFYFFGYIHLFLNTKKAYFYIGFMLFKSIIPSNTCFAYGAATVEP